MNFLRLKKLNRERGSATIEAIISFVGFLFVFFTILNIVNVCRAQALISNAVDTAAKELTQYSYFYEMSGLSKFKGEADKQAEIGANNLNDVISTVDDFTSTVGTAYDNTAQHVTNVQNAVGSNGIDFESIQKEINSISLDADSISASIDSMEAAFGGVVDNPLKYIKSIVAVAGSEFIDTAVSHALAAPLSKAFFTKHFGKNATEASAELERLGVVDGLSGMNFKLSTMFSKEEPDEIHIVVYYKLKLNQVFKWAEFEVPMCKEAVARAWLGGDDVILKVTPVPKPEVTDPPADGENGETTEPGENEETKDEESEETQEPKEPETPKEPEKVDTTNSYWHLGDGGYGVENAGRDKAFMDMYYEEYNIDTDKPGHYDQQKDKDGNFTGNLYRQECMLRSTDESFDAGFYFAELTEIQRQINDGYLPADAKSFTYVVYVPENISDEEYIKMKEDAAKGSVDCRMMMSYMEEKDTAIYADVGITVQIIKAGGNYDYGSGI